jgi:hypothetical protein
MNSQPLHMELFAAANEVCVRTITDVEGGLERQCVSDAAEAIRRQEEERRQEEMVKMAAERDEYEKQDRLRKIEQDRLSIEAAERELQIHKQSLQDAQQGADADHNNNDDDDDGSVATPEGHQVSHTLIHSLLVMIFCHIRELARRNVSWRRRRVGTFRRPHTTR